MNSKLFLRNAIDEQAFIIYWLECRSTDECQVQFKTSQLPGESFTFVPKNFNLLIRFKIVLFIEILCSDFFHLKFFHGPNDVVSLERTVRSGFSPYDSYVTFTIGFNEIVSSNRIKMFGIEKRKCRFSNEITSKRSYPLGVYTQNFCLMECGIEAAMKLCGCRPFFYTLGNLQFGWLPKFSFTI